MSPDPEHDPPSADRADRLRSLRKKLSKLNREAMADKPPARPEPAPPPKPGPPPGTILYRRDLPTETPRRAAEGGGISIPLEQCVEGCEAHPPVGPPFFLIEQPIGDEEAEAAELLARALDALAQRPTPEGVEPLALAPEQLCFIDLETTGLGCCPVFLIGTLVWRDGALVCRQFLARDYAEELSILHAFAEQARTSSAFVSFNGKTFDVPFLRMRAAATGVRLPEPDHHLDLLHEARRVFRHRLPDCKLKTLERYVCQRQRGDDIPGSDIPAAYHDFVHSGDARQIALIVKHNRWDLMTMVHLMGRVLLNP